MKRYLVMGAVLSLVLLPAWAGAEVTAERQVAQGQTQVTQFPLPTPPAKTDAGQIDVRHAMQRWNGPEYASVLAIF